MCASRARWAGAPLITATFHTDSIDCLPLGDLAGTMATLVMGNPDKPEFTLHCASPAARCSSPPRRSAQALGGVSLAEPEVVQWMQESLQEEIEPIFGGVIQ